ncbi:MAG: insertion element uncharacterized 43 [Arthrobacter sp.]|nr:insertion element uncharacterized 43 [Arthrobacter sp.]
MALNRAGKRLFDKALPNDEARLREILDGLSRHGKILLAVDQPATIGALPVAVAQAAGAAVGYLPGLAMRRAIRLKPVEKGSYGNWASRAPETAARPDWSPATRRSTPSARLIASYAGVGCPSSNR